MLSVSDWTRTCIRAASSAGVVTPARLTSPSTSSWLSVRPLSGRCRRSWRASAIMASRSSVAAAGGCDTDHIASYTLLINLSHLKPSLKHKIAKGILVYMTRWLVLVVVTVGGHRAARPARRAVGGAVRRAARRHRAGPRPLAPAGVPRSAGLAAQGVLGVYIGTMVHRDALSRAGPALAGRRRRSRVGTLVLSIVAGALLGHAP